LPVRIADNLRFHIVLSHRAKLRTFASFMYRATSWKRPRKVVARLECSLQPVAGEPGMRQEVDIRYVVTSLEGSAQNRRTRPAAIRPISRGACAPTSRRPRQINPKRVAQRVASHRSSGSDRKYALVQQTGKNAPRHALLRLNHYKYANFGILPSHFRPPAKLGGEMPG
jgi:hypothetical protein